MDINERITQDSRVMLGQRHYYLQLLQRTGHPQQAVDLFLPLLTFLSYFWAKERMSCIIIYIDYLLFHLIYKHYQLCVAFYFYLFFLTRRKNKSAETDVLLNKSQIHFWESPRKREDEAAENWELTPRHFLCARWLETEKGWGDCGDVWVGKTLHKHKDENSNPWQPCQCQMGMLAHL